MKIVRRMFVFCSAAIFVCTLVLWPRSQFYADILLIRTPSANLALIVGDRRGVFFGFDHVPYDGASGPENDGVLGMGRRVAIYSWTAKEFASISAYIFTPPRRSLAAMGFGYANGQINSSTGNSQRYVAVVIPYWFLAIGSAIGPARALRWQLRRREWKRFGLCAQCGYDIHASTGRCPECGMPIPIQSKS